MGWCNRPLSFPVVTGILLLALAVATMLVAGENTPPEITLETPQEEALLGLTVTVSGTATDAEGFNISSYVEMRWNTWEWFPLPSNPAQNGTALYFGETIDLQWHSPGEHYLQVRAFDGELYSEEINITVVRRDLADLVIMPQDITIDPEDPVPGDEVEVTVKVQNQGGEQVEDVTVVLYEGSIEVDRKVIKLLKAKSTRRVQFDMEVDEGNLSLRASAIPEGQVQEPSMDNNFAERTFHISGEDGTEMGVEQAILFFVIMAIFLGMVAWARYNPK
jgi:hypothetical protein